MIPPEKAVAQMHRLAREVHPLCPVWRYDPVLLTSLTSAEFHLDNFAGLAARLEGATDEVVISFAQIYAKSRRNLDAAARRHGFTWQDPPGEAKRELAARLASIAGRHGMRLTVCSQPDYLAPGAGEARCVDVRRLARISGEPLDAPQKGNRPGCACHESRDIGDYDTCPHGCLYCYAVRHRRVALARYRAHDPASPSLLPLEEPGSPRPCHRCCACSRRACGTKGVDDEGLPNLAHPAPLRRAGRRSGFRSPCRPAIPVDGGGAHPRKDPRPAVPRARFRCDEVRRPRRRRARLHGGAGRRHPRLP